MSADGCKATELCRTGQCGCFVYLLVEGVLRYRDLLDVSVCLCLNVCLIGFAGAILNVNVVGALDGRSGVAGVACLGDGLLVGLSNLEEIGELVYLLLQVVAFLTHGAVSVLESLECFIDVSFGGLGVDSFHCYTSFHFR